MIAAGVIVNGVQTLSLSRPHRVMTDRDRRISDQLVRLVQIVFGLVLAQSLLLHRDIIIHPFSGGNWLAALALVTVYVTTVLSWIDWHVTMELRPYNFNPRNRYRLTERARLGLDLSIVTLYAYLLFSIEEFKKAPNNSIELFLLGFPTVFLAYLLSGLARRRSHGKLASNPGPIVIFGIVYFLLCLGYHFAYRVLPSVAGDALKWLNASAIALSFAFMIAYRETRQALTKGRSDKKQSGLKIGIDVDGVLADQIEGLVPRVRARLGIEFRYDDVTEWRLPLGETDIAKEIEIAFEDPEYTISMPVHNGARDLIDELYPQNQIVMLTARPVQTRAWTQQWLENQGFSYDEIVNVKEHKKSFYRSDVLIDDYIGNIKEYLTKTGGTAILVDQPWNRQGRQELDSWIEQKRLHIVVDLRDAVPIVKKLRNGRIGQRH